MKSAPQEPSESDTNYDASVEHFVDLAVETLRDGYHNELETFEVYAERQKAEMRQNLGKYRERLSHGYAVLLEELSKEP